MDDGKKRRFFNIPFIELSQDVRIAKWLLRILSILVALLLWFFVSWDGTAVRTKELKIPLRYEGIPDGYTISDRVREVSVKIEGSLELLALLDRNAITASVSLQGVAPGKYRLPISLYNPDRIRVISYSPQGVEFELYRTIERSMRPVFEVKEEIPADYFIGNVTIDPAEVTVRGTEAGVLSVVRALVQGDLASLQVEGAVELPVTLLAADGSVVRSLDVEPSHVKVDASLSELVEEIEVPIRAIVLGKPGEGLEASEAAVSPDRAILRAPAKQLEGITELTLKPIDITGQTGDIDVEVALDALPPGIAVAGADKVRVTVRLHLPTEARTYLGVPIAVQGKGAYDDWKITPSTVNIIVERNINSTEPFDDATPPVALHIDVSNVVADHLILPVLAGNMPNGVRIVRIEPQQVSVTAVTN